MGRRHRLFPKASLVQVPPKGLCHHSKSVLLPCPPHRIAPLWEKDHISRAERMTRHSDLPSSSHLPLRSHSRTEPATLPWLQHPSTNAVPLPYLKYQGTSKPSPCPRHTHPSVLSLPNPDFKERANVSLGIPSKCVKPPANPPKHKAEPPGVHERFPNILRGRHSQKEEPPHLPFPEHRSEELPHLKKQPPHLKFSPHHQVEELSEHRQKPPTSPPILKYQLEATSLMDHKIRAMGEPSAFLDPQAGARSSSTRSAEATQNHEHQVRILTFVVGGGRTNLWPKCLLLQSPCKDHPSETDMDLEKASDLDYLVNKVLRHPDLAFRETPLPFLNLNQQSGTRASPSSLPKYVNRSTSTEISWSQFNAMFTRITSPDTNHQARVTTRQSRGFIPSTKAASDPSLSLGTWGTSEPFQCTEHATEASPGPDYKVKDTTGPPPHSGHKVEKPSPGADHFKEVSPDLSYQATIPPGPEQRTSPSIVLSNEPAAASSSKTQGITPLFLPINQIESLPCTRLMGKDSPTLQSRGQAGVGEQAEAPVDPDNQVTPSLCPEQQTRAIWDPDCQTLGTLSPDDHVKFPNIFDHQEKEPLVPDTQANLELDSPHYQTQIVPSLHEIIPPLSNKTKAVPPLSHYQTTEPESQATQPPSPPKQEMPQLCPDYWIVPPQTTADNPRETMLDTNAQVTPCQTEVDFRKTMPQESEHQVVTPSYQDDGMTPSQGIDHQVMTPPWQNGSETPSLDIDCQVITPPTQDDIEVPSLDIDHQQLITPPCHEDIEIPSLGIDHQQLITPPCHEDIEIPSLGIDHQQLITPPCHEDIEIPSLDIDHQQLITPPCQDDIEIPSRGIDHQLITLPQQDDGEIPSLGINHQLITPPCQEDNEIPLLDIDHQLITPPCQDDSEIPSLGIDQQHITPSQQDDSETSSQGIDCQVITLPWEDGTETPSLTIQHQVIMSPRQDESKTPSLPIDHQVTTLPWQDDSETPPLGIAHQITTLPWQDASETPPLGIAHQITTLPWQDDSETPPLGIAHQVITLPWQDYTETPSLGIAHQVITLPWEDDIETPSLTIEHQVIMSPWQDHTETPSMGIDCQVITLPWQDDTETPSLTIDHQLITPPGQDDSETPLLGIDHKLITPSWQDDNETPSLGIDHQFITPPHQDDSEMPSLGIDCQVITSEGQDDNSETLGIDHQLITPPRKNNSETLSLGIDHQVTTPPQQDNNTETLSLGIDHQVTTPPCQDNCVVPSRCTDLKITTLSDSNHLTISTPSPDLKLGATLESNEQVTPPHVLNCEATMSVRPEYQNTTSLGHGNQSTLPTAKGDQIIASPMPKKKMILLSTPGQQKETPTGHGHHQDKMTMTSDYRDKSQSRLQHQIVKKREIPWQLKYIKPYTIEGRGNVPARTVRAIINSIPEEKIKRDICKQILFRRMKESPPQRPGECMSTSYSICLECASWVPNGCLHDKDKRHLFEAEMLAIPMPLPGSEEEMGLKFVLRVPYQPFSFFSQLFPELNVQWPLCYSPHFPSLSRKHTVFHVPAKAKCLNHSEMDNYPSKIKISKSQQPLAEENLPTGRESNEKEKSRGHGKGFKSLLEKFQRQRQN